MYQSVDLIVYAVGGGAIMTGIIGALEGWNKILMSLNFVSGTLCFISPFLQHGSELES